MTRDMLIITLGDPNSIGPELLVRLFSQEAPQGRFLIIGPEKVLLHYLSDLCAPPFWTKVDNPRRPHAMPEGVCLWEPPQLSSFQFIPGWARTAGGLAAGIALENAVSLIQKGHAAGLVTLPINKAMFQEAGFNYEGHTEFLSEKAGLSQNEICMHLAGEKLRVSLLTTHPPLRRVPELISAARIVKCLELTADFIKRAFPEQTNQPIAVCGLNPHAGESGRIGLEEIEIIAPAIIQANNMGLHAAGPFPADTIFHRAAQGEFAAVLAMYHDQGLPPLKLLHFHKAVNVTLGLPFVRTSVDHGTAYDLVGKGLADLGSLRQAIAMARALLPIMEKRNRV